MLTAREQASAVRAYLEAAGQLYETGLNLIAVGEQFNVDRRYLRKALPAVGFKLRRP